MEIRLVYLRITMNYMKTVSILMMLVFSQSDEIPEDILKHVTSVYKTPVSATSLAACLKVDSCYIPEKIPYLICTAAIGCVQVTLVNNFDTSENGKARYISTHSNHLNEICESRNFLTGRLGKSILISGTKKEL